MAPSRHDLLGAREELQALVLCRNLAGEVLGKLGEIRQICGVPFDEQAAATPEEHARYEAARVAIDQQRLDWQEAERQRKAEEQAREIASLKKKAIADLRAAEAKANAGEGPAPEKVVPWWEGPKPDGKAAGNLTRVDCLGRQMRLVIEGEDHKLTRLLVRDPSTVAILGGGEEKLGCGVQKPRRIVVEYFAKRNAKSATVGEVATIQFP